MATSRNAFAVQRMQVVSVILTGGLAGGEGGLWQEKTRIIDARKKNRPPGASGVRADLIAKGEPVMSVVQGGKQQRKKHRQVF